MTQKELDKLAGEEVRIHSTFNNSAACFDSYQAGFKKALELVLENELITEVHDCDTLEQLMNNWIGL